MSDIKIFKLVNGDELIGELVRQDSTNGNYVVKSPLSVVIVRGQNGQPAKALSEWVMLAPELKELEIRVDALLTKPIDAPKASADAWRQETSGIVLATQLNG